MTGSRREEPAHLAVGYISKPHGTRGELLVWPLTDRPEAVFSPGAALLVGDADGGLGPEPLAVAVTASRPFRKGLLVRLSGTNDRTAALELVGRYLLAAIEDLQPLDEGEVFYHQLLGLVVELPDGTPVGTITEVFENQPADLLQVQVEKGRTVLVPFTRQVVKQLDAAAGRLVIDPPEGLLEL